MQCSAGVFTRHAVKAIGSFVVFFVFPSVFVFFVFVRTLAVWSRRQVYYYFGVVSFRNTFVFCFFLGMALPSIRLGVEWGRVGGITLLFFPPNSQLAAFRHRSFFATDGEGGGGSPGLETVEGMRLAMAGYDTYITQVPYVPVFSWKLFHGARRASKAVGFPVGEVRG